MTRDSAKKDRGIERGDKYARHHLHVHIARYPELSGSMSSLRPFHDARAEGSTSSDRINIKQYGIHVCKETEKRL